MTIDIRIISGIAKVIPVRLMELLEPEIDWRQLELEIRYQRGMDGRGSK